MYFCLNEFYIVILTFFAGLPPVIKLVDKETLLKEREEKLKVNYPTHTNVAQAD